MDIEENMTYGANSSFHLERIYNITISVYTFREDLYVYYFMNDYHSLITNFDIDMLTSFYQTMRSLPTIPQSKVNEEEKILYEAYTLLTYDDQMLEFERFKEYLDNITYLLYLKATCEFKNLIPLNLINNVSKVVKKIFRTNVINPEFTNLRYYWERLFDYPFELRYIHGLDSPNYEYFEKNLKDAICGHPKASHGWFKESLDELIEMGAINNVNQ